MELTDYEKRIHDNIWTKTELDKWYAIQPDRPDRKEFTEAIKSFIQTWWGCAEFNSDFTRFRRIEHFRIDSKIKHSITESYTARHDTLFAKARKLQQEHTKSLKSKQITSSPFSNRLK